MEARTSRTCEWALASCSTYTEKTSVIIIITKGTHIRHPLISPHHTAPPEAELLAQDVLLEQRDGEEEAEACEGGGAELDEEDNKTDGCWERGLVSQYKRKGVSEHKREHELFIRKEKQGIEGKGK